MRSPQTLSEADRRIVAIWAADCSERVLGIFEAAAPGERGPRDAIARARAFARGELDASLAIRRRFAGGACANEAISPAAAAAARAAGQAGAVAHMGAHALGAAAYAAKATGLAALDDADAVDREIQWQLDAMSSATRVALRQLPALGENRSGPLGPGLLASGQLGSIIRELQQRTMDLIPPGTPEYGLAHMTETSTLITGVDFVCIPAEDFDAMTTFYGETLGLPLVKRYGSRPGAEFQAGNLTLAVMRTADFGGRFSPNAMPIALQVDDVASAREQLEAKGVRFVSETFDSGVCLQAICLDPDGNPLSLHHRYAPKD